MKKIGYYEINFAEEANRIIGRRIIRITVWEDNNGFKFINYKGNLCSVKFENGKCIASKEA